MRLHQNSMESLSDIISFPHKIADRQTKQIYVTDNIMIDERYI